MRFVRLARLCVIGVLLLTTARDVRAASTLALVWNPDTGSNIAGYELAYGTTSGAGSGDYAFHQDVGNQTTATVTNLLDGTTYYFAVRAYDTSGQYSDYSNEVSTTTGAPSCTFTVSPASATYGALGGSGSEGVTTASGCAWTATSGASWIGIVGGASGSGSGAVSYTVAANTSTASRTGALIIAGQAVTISQAGATGGTGSPDGTRVPRDASQIVDAGGNVWSLAANSLMLQNGQSALFGIGTTILWWHGSIYGLDLLGNWWQWGNGSWTNVGQTAPDHSSGSTGSTSPDGTRVPRDASQIVDAAGNVWTIAANGLILENGHSALFGVGTTILWWHGTIYGLDSLGNWWQWWGNGGWTNVGQAAPDGPIPSTSPDGTRVPRDASQIVDSAANVWSIAANGIILKNGQSALYGVGTAILWWHGSIYGLDFLGNWWQWGNGTWTNVGQTSPDSSISTQSSPSPDGTRVPRDATQIVDAAGNIWTLAANGLILENNHSALYGIGAAILWSHGSIYGLDLLGNWWQWTGNGGWTNLGPAAPDNPRTAPPSPDGTRVPRDATQIVDAAGNVWTIAPNGLILENGHSALYGVGAAILWWHGSVYGLDLLGNWWQWGNGTWTNVGAAAPDTVAGHGVAVRPATDSTPPVATLAAGLRAATAAPGPTPASPVTSVSAAAPAIGLIQPAQLVYQGAFRVPVGAIGGSVFNNGGTALAFNPARGSLFVVGDPADQQVAEIAIPTVVRSPVLADLSTAAVLQPFADPANGALRLVYDNIGNPATFVGGVLPYGDRLYISAYMYADESGGQRLSHFVTGLNLGAKSQVQGPYQVGALGAGLVDGYFALVPSAWQAALGGPVLVGQCCLWNISRTSSGPAAFAVNPADIGTVNPVPAQPLVYYPQAHPLLDSGTTGDGWHNTSGLFNGTTEVKGAVFPTGTSSVLFFGRQGMGALCYGTGTSDATLAGTPARDGSTSCYDPENAGLGPHAYPYSYRVWAYNAADLAAVTAGTANPWDVRPYAAWSLQLPFGARSTHLNGAAYDPTSGRLFLAQASADGSAPVIHVFTVGLP